MKTPTSAGLLMYRTKHGFLEVFIVHPGGPYFLHRDEGAWTIPKGLVEEGEEMLNTAIREFGEETGLKSQGEYIPLGYIQQKGGKIVHGWAFSGDWNGEPIKSNEFELEWPVNSGKYNSYPEVDRGDFFTPEAAKRKINPAQISFIERLEDYLKWNK